MMRLRDLVDKSLDDDPEGEQAQQDAAERAEDQARGDRWDAFIKAMREAMEQSPYGLGERSFVILLSVLWLNAYDELLDERGFTPNPSTTLNTVFMRIGPLILDFAHTDGWDGVLSACSRVYREMHRDLTEMERRR